jgi:tetratricopeptide (TPR) repeat protein
MRPAITLCAWASLGLLASATPVMAEMSACQSVQSVKDPRERIADYTVCIKRGGNGASMTGVVYAMRGLAYGQLGDLDAALKDYSSAIELNPEIDAVYALRGEIYANRGDWLKAQTDFDGAIAHRHEHHNLSVFLDHKAWLFATWQDASMRDGAQAVALALKAAKLANDSSVHDVLAAAYAEAGQFDSAVREESDAINRIQHEKERKDLPGFEARLSLYRSGIPYRADVPFPRMSENSDAN